MIYHEIKRFLITGILSNAINFSVYMILTFVSKNIIFSSMLGYILGLSSSYYLGKLWVFDSESKVSLVEVSRFLVVYLIGGLGMVGIIWILSSKSGMDYRLSWFFGACFAVVNNFFGSKFFAFK
jgi:putative flippase GtrA